MNTEDRLFTIQEAARYMSVSRATIYNMIHAEVFPVYRPVPDAPRLKKSDIDAYLLQTAGLEAG